MKQMPEWKDFCSLTTRLIFYRVTWAAQSGCPQKKTKTQSVCDLGFFFVFFRQAISKDASKGIYKTQ